MFKSGLALFAFSLTTLASCATAPSDLTNPSSTPVYYILEVAIQEGKLEEFRNLMSEMVAATKTETGTRVYEWYLADDETTCQIHELFADTDAYKEHSKNFGANFATRFMPCVTIKNMTVYGNADSEARELLSSLSPKYFNVFGGFFR
jgi:quinol monooxygenase YgiN